MASNFYEHTDAEQIVAEANRAAVLTIGTELVEFLLDHFPRDLDSGQIRLAVGEESEMTAETAETTLRDLDKLQRVAGTYALDLLHLNATEIVGVRTLLADLSHPLDS